MLAGSYFLKQPQKRRKCVPTPSGRNYPNIVTFLSPYSLALLPFSVLSVSQSSS